MIHEDFAHHLSILVFSKDWPQMGSIPLETYHTWKDTYVQHIPHRAIIIYALYVYVYMYIIYIERESIQDKR